MNNVNLVGRVTRDIELKYGQSGSAYTKFSLAVNRMKKGECDFINCTAFGKTAELIAKYVNKGGQLAVSGSINVNKHEDKSYTTVNVFSITLIGGGEKKDATPKQTNDTKQTTESSDGFPF